MDKINSKEFSSYIRVLKGLFPKAKHVLNSAAIFYAPNGGKYKNGAFKLQVKINGKVEHSMNVSSTTPVLVDGVEHYALEFARELFLFCVARIATVKVIAEMFYSEIADVYKASNIEYFDNYYVISFYDLDIKPNNSIFTLTGKINYIVCMNEDFKKVDVIYKFHDLGYVQYFEKYSEEPNVHTIDSVIGMLEGDSLFSNNALKFFSRSLKSSYENVLDALDILSPDESYKDRYSLELKSKIIKTVVSDGKVFEDVVYDFLCYIFQDCFDLFEMRVQEPNQRRLRIRDFIVINTSPRVKFLEHLRNNGANHLLFDAKNYKEKLTTSDLDTFFNYIAENDNFGKIGFILSRNGMSENLEQLIFRKMLRGEAEVIVLDEGDLIKMIDIKSSGRNPISYLERKLSKLRLKM